MSTINVVSSDKQQGPIGEPLKPVAAYLPFVRKLALRQARKLPSHVLLDDLMSAGVVGLLEAFKRYDETRVSNFEKFAEFRIKGAMLDDLRRRDLMARDARSAQKRLERSISELRSKLGRDPLEEEIAEGNDVSVEALRLMFEKLMPVSEVSFADLKTFEPQSDGDTPFDETSKRQMVALLGGAIGKLSKRQQQVLQLYYYEELTLREVGEVLSVSESRVCQIVSEATVRLRVLIHGKKGVANV